jgi:tRNA nucleotidyltransferase (CCA-adding enzyme)
MEVQLFRVGGCVRDHLLGIPCDDIDFVAVVEGSKTIDAAFAEMIRHVKWDLGLSVVSALVNREHVTIKALVPKGHALRSECGDVDVVLARIDGPSSDGRHPDWVKAGSLGDDQARRDLTINSICQDAEGALIDPFDGQGDIRARIIRFVGDPMTRIREDGLRVLRALRFAITKGFAIEAADNLRGCSSERIQKELNKMLRHDHVATIQTLARFPHVTATIFAREDCRLEATMKKPKGKKAPGAQR